MLLVIDDDVCFRGTVSAQAKELNEMVEALVAVVGGSAGAAGRDRRRPPTGTGRRKVATAGGNRSLPAPARQARSGAAQAPKVLNPEKVLAVGEEDLDDFQELSPGKTITPLAKST